jgi:hypothetical protein
MSVERLLGVMKQAGVGAVEAGNPVAVLFGEVESSKPLAVRVDQRFTLPAAFLIVPESLFPYELELQHEHGYVDSTGTGTANRKTDRALSEPTVIRRGLEEGDKVLLLRIQGGQQYVVLDRVVNA